MRSYDLQAAFRTRKPDVAIKISFIEWPAGRGLEDGDYSTTNQTPTQGSVPSLR
jgi:hypothetical protein